MTLAPLRLDAARLTALQRDCPPQLGAGWYAACEAEVAWFFASLAPGNVGRWYTVIEIDIPDKLLNDLIAARQAVQSTIANVPFVAQQYSFTVDAFAILNARATLRPHLGQELSDG
jgi:hypothetical protein